MFRAFKELNERMKKINKPDFFKGDRPIWKIGIC
jgi:hypothetical protein